MKSLRLFLLLCIFSQKLLGQTVLLLEMNFMPFGDTKGPSYHDSTIHALIFYIDENSKDNIMRLYFKTKNGDKYIGEQRLTAKMENLGDTSEEYLVLRGHSTKNLSGKFFKEDYYIACYKGRNDIGYLPVRNWLYRNNDTNSKIVEGDLTSINDGKDIVMNVNDLTDSLLHDFGIEKKPDNIKALSGSTLHLMLVTHSNDPDVGGAFSINNDGLRNTFQNIAALTGMQLKVVEVSGDDFEKKSVEDMIGNYKVGPDDVLIFYYSGHGFRMPEQTSKYPYLLLRSNFLQEPKEHTLLLEDINKTLERKNARLTIVVGECCNIDTRQSDVKEKHTLVMRPSESFSLDVAKVKKLFSSSGKIFVASCSPGERSAYRTEGGGIFFNNLRSNIYGFTSLLSARDVSWEKILAASVENTEREVISMTDHTQLPIVEINMKK